MSCYSEMKISGYVFTWNYKYESMGFFRKGDKATSETFYAGIEKETSWKLHFYPVGDEYASKDYASIHLQMTSDQLVKASYWFSIQSPVNECIRESAPSNVEFWEKGSNHNNYGFRNFVLKNRICYGLLKIRCGLKIEEERDLLPYCVTPQNLNDLATDFSSLLGNAEHSDVTIKADGKEFRVHKAILSVRSEVFAAMFAHDMQETRESTVEITDTDGETLQELLLYLYSSKLNPINSKLAQNLFVAADKYRIKGLGQICSDFMASNLTPETAPNVLLLGDMHGDQELQQQAKMYILKNACDVLGTSEWLTLVKERPDIVNVIIMSLRNLCPDSALNVPEKQSTPETTLQPLFRFTPL